MPASISRGRHKDSKLPHSAFYCTLKLGLLPGCTPTRQRPPQFWSKNKVNNPFVLSTLQQRHAPGLSPNLNSRGASHYRVQLAASRDDPRGAYRALSAGGLDGFGATNRKPAWLSWSRLAILGL